MLLRAAQDHRIVQDLIPGLALEVQHPLAGFHPKNLTATGMVK